MKRKEYLRLLKTVEKLKALPENKLLKIADCLEESTFQKEDYIIRQGDAGDTFYIIEEGKVKVTQFEVRRIDVFKEILLKIGFIEEMRTTSGNKEVP